MKKLNITSSILLFYLICLGELKSLCAISLDESGYYNLVVAIDETTVQNSVQDYVLNIQEAFEDLSALLHFTTNGKFALKTVNILVPPHWNVPTAESATIQHYEGADVKISHRHYLPIVENPNSCGRPGQDILLPYDFFNSLEDGNYGRLGKALLTQFVRLRYGAWEEHGYPGDPEFPYYWKPLENTTWEVTACTNAPINGVYQTIDGTDCGPDPGDVDNLYPPPNECRFFPKDVQTANSSLMTYHFLKNVDQFCDFNTHNRKVPTPQNLYCKYRSVKEVIEQSPDWKQTTKSNPGGAPIIKIVKNYKDRPLLYVLLDGGVSQAPGRIIKKISDNLKSLVSTVDLRDLTMGVGRFPGDKENESFSRIVPWSSLQNSTIVDSIKTVFDSSFNSKRGFRNYGAAIKSIILELKGMRHESGAIILIVKTSAESNKIDLTPELEILLPLHDANIKVWAIEIEGNIIQPGISLRQIVGKNQGNHLTISTTLDNLDQSLTDYFDQLKDTLKTSFGPSRDVKLIFKEIVPLDASVIARMPQVSGLQIFIIPLSGEITGDGPRLLGGSGDNGGYLQEIDFTGSEIINWDDPLRSSKNGLYREEDIFNLNELTWTSFSYECATQDCKVLLIMFAAVSDSSVFNDGFRVEVLTSAINNIVDLSVENTISDIGSPFIVYAKLQQDRVPIRSVKGLSVIATIYQEERTWASKIELKDQGFTSPPDITLNDGIFSGTFVPNSDGNYRIFVTVKYIPEPASSQLKNFNESILQSSAGKLFPIDQVHMGCGSGYLGCWSKEPEAEFITSAELYEVLEFKNANSYKTYAYRITDFRLTPLNNYEIRFEWTSPRGAMKIDSNIQDEVYEYALKLSDDFDKLLYEFENCSRISLLSQPQPPGYVESLTHSYGRESKLYFAIKSYRISDSGSELLESEISLISSVEIKEESVSTTTIVTPTATPPTSTSTTTTTPPPTTEATGPTGDISSTTVQFNRTTIERSTNAPITTIRTTTVMTTTPSPPIMTTENVKHWYEEKEGIITLSVFGAAVILIFAGGLAFMWFTKYR